MTDLMETFHHHKLRVIRVLLISYFTTRILIRVLGEKYGDSSDAVWSMYLTEAEKEDTKEIESWTGDTDGILVFVSLTLSCVYSLAKAHLEDRSFFCHRRNVHYRKLSELVAQFQ